MSRCQSSRPGSTTRRTPRHTPRRHWPATVGPGPDVPPGPAVEPGAGWRTYATNPDSGTYGIAQSLPPGKYASSGTDWLTSYAPRSTGAWVTSPGLHQGPLLFTLRCMGPRGRQQQVLAQRVAHLPTWEPAEAQGAAGGDQAPANGQQDPSQRRRRCDRPRGS